MEFDPRVYFPEPIVAKSEADELVLEWALGEGDKELRVMFVTGGEEGTYVIETFFEDKEIKQNEYWGDEAAPALLRILQRKVSEGTN